MPFLDTNYGQIFYKEFGKGQSVVFLNGLAMSTSSWSPFIRRVSQNYKMLVVDLIDQGLSKGYEKPYSLNNQVDLLKEIFLKLNIDKAHLVGMSYGGKLALSFTLKHPDMVYSLILANTDSYTSNFNKELAKAWANAASTLDGHIFSSALLPYMYSMDYFEYNEKSILEKKKYFLKVLDERWSKRFIRTLDSTRDYNIKDQLNKIKKPCLVISADEDICTPKKSQEIIHKNIENSQWKIVKGSGHALMFEKPQEFIELVLDFLIEYAT